MAAGARSIAFPAISTGIYGYPVGEATATAVQTVKRILAGLSPASRPAVTFVCFDASTLACYEAVLEGAD